MPSIAIVLPNLRLGGAEMLHVRLAERFVERGHRVDFVLLQAEGALLARVPPGVRVTDLEVGRLRSAVGPLRDYVRSNKPDVLMVAMWPLTVIGILANLAGGDPSAVVVSDHVQMSMDPVTSRGVRNALARVSIRALYPLAKERIVVSRGAAADLSQLSGLPIDRFTVIHNPAVDGGPPPRHLEDPWPSRPGARVLSVGNLKAQKDHATLLRAFARTRAQREATLVILGEGPERGQTEALARQLGVEGDLLLPGQTLDTGPWYQNADLFVLSSTDEGFGNVLVEALEHGLPIVSTDCPSGPAEILQGGAYGVLVPVGDPEALGKAILEGLETQPDVEALFERSQVFSSSTIASRYLDVIFR